MEWRILLLTSFLGIAVAMSAYAQIRRPEREVTGSATIEGRVRDAFETSFANFTVIANDASSGRQLGTTTDVEGRFRIENVPDGSYDVTATREGFQTVTVSGIRVQSNERRSIDIVTGPETSTSPLKFSRMTESPTGPVETLPNPNAIRRPETGVPEEAPPPPIKPTIEDFVPIPDRWRIPRPPWTRYPSGTSDAPYIPGSVWDPYNQNVLKGDYPILGTRWFLNLSAVSDTLAEGRRVPVAGPASSQLPEEPGFFSRGEQFQFVQSLLFSADFSRGVTAFRPVDLRLRITPVVNGNFLATRETGVVNINIARGNSRWDSYAPGLQEAFVEARLAETSSKFDFISVRAGTQAFLSDFRGFIFSDNEPGLRVFGNLRSNRHQYNFAYFHMLEKDTNSLLNTFKSRQQEVMIANYYIQDFIKPGYTTQFSFHYNRDKPTFHIDNNGFLARPAPLGRVRPRSVNAIYLGWTGDGHLGRLNVNHAFYQVLGRERPVNREINAQMAALELSVDQDWKRYRFSLFYASGDRDLTDGRARGFDSIFDNVQFAGGSASFWNRQAIRLTGTRLGLIERFSLHPALRTTKEEGQSNFSNPGLFLANAAVDAEITPKLRGSLNANFMAFPHTQILETLLEQSPIQHKIGLDLGMSVRWRPWLNDNVIFNAGAAALLPAAGFRNMFNDQTLFSSFVELRLAY